jgi:hypothetical protein
MTTMSVTHVSVVMRWTIAVSGGAGAEDSFDSLLTSPGAASRAIPLIVALSVGAAKAAKASRVDDTANFFFEAVKPPSAQIAHAELGLESPVFTSHLARFRRQCLLEAALAWAVNDITVTVQMCGKDAAVGTVQLAIDWLAANSLVVFVPTWIRPALANALIALRGSSVSPMHRTFHALLGELLRADAEARRAALVCDWAGGGVRQAYSRDSSEIRQLCDALGGPATFHKRWRAFAPVFDLREADCDTYDLPSMTVYMRPPYWFPGDDVVLRHGSAPIVATPNVTALTLTCLQPPAGLETAMVRMTLTTPTGPSENLPGTPATNATCDAVYLFTPALALCAMHQGGDLQLVSTGHLRVEPDTIDSDPCLLWELIATAARTASATQYGKPQELNITFTDDHMTMQCRLEDADLAASSSAGPLTLTSQHSLVVLNEDAAALLQVTAAEEGQQHFAENDSLLGGPLLSEAGSMAREANEPIAMPARATASIQTEVIVALLNLGFPLESLPQTSLNLRSVLAMAPHHLIAALRTSLHDCINSEDMLRRAAAFVKRFELPEVLVVLDAVASYGESCALLEELEPHEGENDVKSIADTLGIPAAAMIVASMARRGGAWDAVDNAVRDVPQVLMISAPHGCSVISAACRGGYFKHAARLLAKVPVEKRIAIICPATDAAFVWADGDAALIARIREEWLGPASTENAAKFRLWIGNPFIAMRGCIASGAASVTVVHPPNPAEVQAMLAFRAQLCITDANIVDFCAALMAWERRRTLGHVRRRSHAIDVDGCVKAIVEHPRTNLGQLLRAGVLHRLPQCSRIGEAILLMGTSVKCCSVKSVGSVNLTPVASVESNVYRFPLHALLSLSIVQPIDHEFAGPGRQYWEHPRAPEAMANTSFYHTPSFAATFHRLRRSAALLLPNVGVLAFTATRCHARNPSSPEHVAVDLKSRKITIGSEVLSISALTTVLPGVLQHAVKVHTAAVYFAFVYPKQPTAEVAASDAWTTPAITPLDTLLRCGGLAMLDRRKSDVVDLVALEHGGNDMLFDGPFIADVDFQLPSQGWRTIPESLPDVDAALWESQLSMLGVERYAWLDGDAIAPMGGFLLDLGAEVGLTDLAATTPGRSGVFNPSTSQLWEEDERIPRYVYCPVHPDSRVDGGSRNPEAVKLAVAVVNALVEDKDQWAETFCAAPPTTMYDQFSLLTEMQLVHSSPLQLAVRLHCLPVVDAMLHYADAHIMWQPHRVSQGLTQGDHTQQLLTEAIRLLPLSAFDIRSFPVAITTRAGVLRVAARTEFDIPATISARPNGHVVLESPGFAPQRISVPEEVDPVDEQRPVSNRIAFALPTLGARFPDGAMVYLDWTNRIVSAESFVDMATLKPLLDFPVLPPPQLQTQTTGAPGRSPPTLPDRPPQRLLTARATATPIAGPADEFGVDASDLVLFGPVATSFVRPADVVWSAGETCPRALVDAVAKAQHPKSRRARDPGADSTTGSPPIVQWGWLDPGRAPCSNPSGAFVLRLSDSSEIAYSIVSEVRVWEPGYAVRGPAILPRPAVACRIAIVRRLLEYTASSDDGFGLFSTPDGIDVTNLALLLQYGCEELARLAIPIAADGIANATNTSVDIQLRRCPESRVALYVPTQVTRASGFNMLVKEDRGLSLLHWASLYGSPALMNTVLSLGSRSRDVGRLLSAEAITSAVFHRTALHFAAYCGDADCLKTLLGFEPMKQVLDAGECSLEELIRREALVRHGDLMVTDNRWKGPTPLQIAVMFRNAAATTALIEAGANPLKSALFMCDTPAKHETVDAHGLVVVRRLIDSTPSHVADIGRPPLLASSVAAAASIGRTRKVTKRLEHVALRIVVQRLIIVGFVIAMVWWFITNLEGRNLLHSDLYYEYSDVARAYDVSGISTFDEFNVFATDRLLSQAQNGANASTGIVRPTKAAFVGVVSRCASTSTSVPFRATLRGLARSALVVSHLTDHAFDLQDASWYDTTPGESSALGTIGNAIRDQTGQCDNLVLATLPVVNVNTQRVLVVTLGVEIMNTGTVLPFQRIDAIALGRIGYSTPAGKVRIAPVIGLWLTFLGLLVAMGYRSLERLIRWSRLTLPDYRSQPPLWPSKAQHATQALLKAFNPLYVAHFILTELLVMFLCALLIGLVLSYDAFISDEYHDVCEAARSVDSALKYAFTPRVLGVAVTLQIIRLLSSFLLLVLVWTVIYTCVLIPRIGPTLARLRAVISMKVLVILALATCVAFAFALALQVAYPAVFELRTLRRSFIHGFSGVVNGWELEAEGSITVDTHSYNVYMAIFNLIVVLCLTVVVWVIIWIEFEKDTQAAQDWWVHFIEQKYLEDVLTGTGAFTGTVASTDVTASGREAAALRSNHESTLFNHPNRAPYRTLASE